MSCHGFYAASTDPERLEAQLRMAPNGMLAIRTGAASGMVVVDIDPAHGGRVDPELMPATRYVVTGSAGYHLWYWHPGTPVPCSAGRLAPGIDVRGDGGYAVLPPSRHPRTGRPYVWGTSRDLVEMPTGLVGACQPPQPPAPGVGRVDTHSAVGISSPAALLNAHLEAVRQAPEGRRRVTLYGSSRGVARMVAAGVVSTSDAWAVLTDAGRAAGQSAREIRGAILGGFRDEGVAA